MSRYLAIALTIVTSLLTAFEVHAETRISVPEFSGPEADRLRSETEHVFERQDDVTVVPHEEVEKLARRLGVDVGSPEGRKQLARQLQLSAWIAGSVKKRSGEYHLTVVVYDGADHARVGRTVISGKSSHRLRSELRDELWSKTKDALFLAVAPLPAGRGVPDAEQKLASSASNTSILAAASDARGEQVFNNEEMRDDSSPARVHRFNTDTARVALGVGTPYRTFAFSDPVTQGLSDSQLSAVPLFDMSLAYYPARAFTSEWASWIGIDAAAALSLAASTNAGNGVETKARYSMYRVGARVRAPVGNHSLSAFSGYAVTRLTLDGGENDGVARTPQIDYRSIRSGAGTELTITDAMALGVDVAYLKFLSVGELSEWFPRASAGGVELALTAHYVLTKHLFARVSAAYQRNFFDFHSRPGDARAAGGATDQYMTMSIGVGASL